MIQFREEEVCQIIKALTYYRDKVTGHDDIWDRYDHLVEKMNKYCLLYTSPSPRDGLLSRMPSSA